ncbi:MAG: Rieske 2Fe-2S domain-containing protein [Tabrizicola sp.]
MCLDRAGELANLGDDCAFDSPGGPISLIRGIDGLPRSFANCCRPRGSVLPDGSGSVVGRVACPCHARTYRNDGRLCRCPVMKDPKASPRSRTGWWLDLDAWEGSSFARFPRDGPSLPAHQHDFPDRMTGRLVVRLRLLLARRRSGEETKANEETIPAVSSPCAAAPVRDRASVRAR